MGDLEGDSLDAKLAKLREDFGEDIAVYDFGDETFGSALEEDLNDFNDETFGGGSVGRDFDFSGSTAKFAGAPLPQSASAPKSSAAAWTTMPNLLSSSGVGVMGSRKPSSPWSGGLNEDPLLGPMAVPSEQPPARQAPKPTPIAPPISAARAQPRMRTLEEIEAEMMATKPVTPTPPSAQSAAGRKPLTLEEVEAEMLKKARPAPATSSSPTPPATRGMQSPARALPHRASPTGLSAKAQAAQQTQVQQRSMSPATPMPIPEVPMPGSLAGPGGVTPISYPAHPAHPQHQDYLRLQQQQQQLLLQQQLALQQQMALLQQQQQRGGVRSPQSSLSGPQALAALMSGAPATPVPITGNLRVAAENRIQQHEHHEAARRRKGAKIAEMSRYNGLMTQSDKDFITRIQISQIVHPSAEGGDPFADDFYFHVYSAIKMSRLASMQQAQAAAVDQQLQPGQKIMVLGGGESVGAGVGAARGAKGEKRLTRREHAMVRLAQNVQRIVDQAKERPKMTQLSLDGALGKIALRTRSAPRQLLQVQTSASSDSLARTAADGENHPGVLSNVLPTPHNSNERRPAMNKRQLLMAVERLYACVLEIEQLRRNQPILPSSKEEPSEGGSTQQDAKNWESQYEALKETIWRQWRMLEPLDISVPHPFISLLSCGKGKKLLPRTIRLFTHEQSLQILTLLVATFSTLDVVRDSDLVDRAADPRLAPPLEGRRSRVEATRETELFMHCVVGPMMSVINSTSLELVSGLLALLMDRNKVLNVARSKPGIAFITLFLSRGEMLRHLKDKEGTPAPDAPSQQAVDSWMRTIGALHDRLSGDFASLFPSTRVAASLPPGTHDLVSDLVPRTEADLRSRAETFGCDLDYEDAPVWQMLTALAVASDASRQERLLAGIRTKVMDNVTAARKKLVPEPAEETKLRNVNSLLQGLGLDASMITIQ